MIFVILISKPRALEKIILILDQTINGNENRIREVWKDISLNSSPSSETRILSAVPLNK